MISIDISKSINRPGEVFDYEFSGKPEMEGIEFARPLLLKATYCNTGGSIRLKGGFNTAIAVECVRCLEPVEFDISYEFDELFLKKADDDSYAYSGDVLSMDKMLYDAIMLAIPQNVLCSDDCLGICQMCGKDLNRQTCECKAEEISRDNPFLKLKDLQ